MIGRIKNKTMRRVALAAFSIPALVLMMVVGAAQGAAYFLEDAAQVWRGEDQ